MKYDSFICSHSEKKIRVSTVYKIKDMDSEEHIILINRACPHTNCTDCEKCQNCYGTVSHSIQKVKNKKGAAKMVKTTRIDRFIDTKDEIINILEATNFLSDIEILDVVSTQNNVLGQSINIPYIAYDRPNTWKTDCINCKNKYLKEDSLTPCQKATEHFNNAGINLEFVTTKQIIEHELPEECICREQTQRIVYVY